MSNCSCNINQSDIRIVPVKVDEKLLDMLEKYYYEYNGLLNAVAQFGSDTPFKPDIERYKLLINEYLEVFVSYNIVYNLVYSTAIKSVEEAVEGLAYESSVDFGNGVINIYLDNIIVSMKK